MFGALGYQLYACGKKGLPEQITFDNNTYKLHEIFKHDFFAATAVYQSSSQSQTPKTDHPHKIVLKVSREQHFWGLPLAWLGEFICRHEVSILHRLRHLNQVPRLLSNYGPNAFLYEYIPGCTLSEKKDLPEDFFDRLQDLLQQLHQVDIIYLDMNKRDNLLIDSDGNPYFIDFQISLYFDDHFLIFRKPSEYLRNILQKADLYHLFKHKRRMCPDLLRPQEKTLSCNISRSIKLHRWVATPLRKLRRRFLKYMDAKGFMVFEKNTYFDE